MLQSIKKNPTFWKLQNIKEIKVHTSRKASDVHGHIDSNKPGKTCNGFIRDSFREQPHIAKPS